MDTKQGTVRAAGTVLWRHAAAGIEVALVHRPHYDDWSLPKGKLTDGETPAHAAVRETLEETGFAGTLSRRLGTVSYRLPSGREKSVDYFAARCTGGGFAANAEVDAVRWLPVPEAVKLAGYDTDAGVLAEFAALPADVRPLLLVRHAKAGKRSEWTGDDDLRPLAAAGVAQARALRSLLPLFGVTRVFSAPPLRCEQTVREVARDLGVALPGEPWLSEEHYWDYPDRGVRRLLEIAGGDGVAAVCSQGGAIPDLLERLTARWPEPPVIACKKASVWALFFDADPRRPRLLAADYYPSPLPVPSTG